LKIEKEMEEQLKKMEAAHKALVDWRKDKMNHILEEALKKEHHLEQAREIEVSIY
jgi:hypothetical protein